MVTIFERGDTATNCGWYRRRGANSLWISASSYSGKEPTKSALCETNIGRRPVLACPYVALNHFQARDQPQFPLARGGRWKYGAKKKSVSLATRYRDFPRKPQLHSPYHGAPKYFHAITRDESRERTFLSLPPKNTYVPLSPF